ncbi:Predicted protein [Komagataella phaffii CBS 7435]|nr:Predicted protein [Komagataella phaffii CBS 7435]
MSALFNFSSLLQVLILMICTCTYIHGSWPAVLDKNKTGILGVYWKFARIGERMSPYVSISCIIIAINQLR